MSNKQQQQLIAAAGVVIVILLLLSLSGLPRSAKAPGGPASLPTTVIAQNTTIQGNYAVPAGKRTVLQSGAKLTVTGDFTVDGELGCDGGPVQVTVDGALHVSKSIDCQLANTNAASQGISIVAIGDVTFDPTSSVTSNGSIQIVDDAKKLATNAQSIDALFAEAAKADGGKLRVGPFLDGKTTSLEPSSSARRK